MKRILSLIMALALCALMMTGALAENVYSATISGFGGPMTVEVTVEGEQITAVAITSNTETPGIGTNAIDMLPGRIVEHQSIALDVVSGCTVTSNAIFSGVAAALENSGFDLEKLNTAPEKAVGGEEIELTTDIVVVGGGMAGLAAAVKADELGASVILLEKMSFTGGNSALSTGILHFGATDYQAAAGIADTKEAFYEFAMAKSENRRDPVQVRLIADHGSDAVNWLASTGVEISDKVSLITGGDPNIARGHQALPNAAAMTATVTEYAIANGVDVRLNTPATELIVDESGAVCGVIAKDNDGNILKIQADKVVLAVGGFVGDPAMIEKYWGMTGVGYAGTAGTTGEMIDACIALGADTMDIEQPWLTPTVEYETDMLITAMVLAGGAILVDDEGNRFCDEEASYAQTSAAVQALGQDYVYEVLDTHTAEAVDYKFPSYQAMGVVIEANTLEELAEKIGVPAENLVATVETYNAAVRGDQADPFGRTIVHEECNKAPYYAIRVRPGTVMSAGGLKVNENFEVIKTDGTTIPNVYATGEMTGGYRAYGYIGGDALGHALVSGLIAGQHAAENK